jgi:hypothetical protein
MAKCRRSNARQLRITFENDTRNQLAARKTVGVQTHDIRRDCHSLGLPKISLNRRTSRIHKEITGHFELGIPIDDGNVRQARTLEGEGVQLLNRGRNAKG